MEPLILLDTSELLRPTQRKLHAAWNELDGQQTCMPPTVGTELAPLGVPSTDADGRSAAERQLQHAAGRMDDRRILQLRQQAWWSAMWRDPQSPYRLIELTSDQQHLQDDLLEAIDRDCFPTADPDQIALYPDARIVTEAMALGAKVLLTSNLRSMDHYRLNDWAVAKGGRLGFRPEPVVLKADDALIRWSESNDGHERLLQAGLFACWPQDDNAPVHQVWESTLDGITKLIRSGKLADTGGRIINELERHIDGKGLIERTRRRLPSATVATDREHPTYPHAA